MKRLILLATITSTLALAQQQSSIEEALWQRMTLEVHFSIECTSLLIDTQRALEIAKARINELGATAADN
jgi:hypothetical protein